VALSEWATPVGSGKYHFFEKAKTSRASLEAEGGQVAAGPEADCGLGGHPSHSDDGGGL
jgi:hypothetical protein